MKRQFLIKNVKIVAMTSGKTKLLTKTSTIDINKL